MKLTSIMFCNYVYIRNLFYEKEIGTVGFRKFRSDPDISEAFLVTCQVLLLCAFSFFHYSRDRVLSFFAKGNQVSASLDFYH